MTALAFDLAHVWKTTPDHYLAKPLSELLQDEADSLAFIARLKATSLN